MNQGRTPVVHQQVSGATEGRPKGTSMTSKLRTDLSDFRFLVGTGTRAPG